MRLCSVHHAAAIRIEWLQQRRLLGVFLPAAFSPCFCSQSSKNHAWHSAKHFLLNGRNSTENCVLLTMVNKTWSTCRRDESQLIWTSADEWWPDWWHWNCDQINMKLAVSCSQQQMDNHKCVVVAGADDWTGMQILQKRFANNSSKRLLIAVLLSLGLSGNCFAETSGSNSLIQWWCSESIAMWFQFNWPMTLHCQISKFVTWQQTKLNGNKDGPNLIAKIMTSCGKVMCSIPREV